VIRDFAAGCIRYKQETPESIEREAKEQAPGWKIGLVMVESSLAQSSRGHFLPLALSAGVTFHELKERGWGTESSNRGAFTFGDSRITNQISLRLFNLIIAS